MLPGLDSLPVVDTELRAELEMVGGPELPPRLVHMFLDDVPSLIEQIQVATGSGDSVTVSRSAHRIKGGAAAVGARRVAAVAKAIEFAGKQARLPEVPSLLPVLDTTLGELRSAFPA